LIIKICFSPCGRKIIVGYSSKEFIYGRYEKALSLWDVNTKKIIYSFIKDHQFNFYSGLRPEGYIVFSGQSCEIEPRDLKFKQFIKGFHTTETGNNLNVCFSPDGKMILLGKDNCLQLWDFNLGNCIQTFETNSRSMTPIKAICFSPDGTKIATCGDEIVVYKLDYDLTFPGWADWDDGALPYVETFLTLHPDYTDSDFENLIIELQNRGYGWLRPEGVRAKLAALRKTLAPRIKGFLGRLFGKTVHDTQ
jgi:WD40 repeat protein